jgi:hypothetical protein
MIEPGHVIVWGPSGAGSRMRGTVERISDDGMVRLRLAGFAAMALGKTWLDVPAENVGHLYLHGLITLIGKEGP